ncbi:MAG TPA: hypothetical protein VIN10_14910 [Bacteroidales bacterium]
MYLSILHIRLKQVYRASSGLGLFRSIVALGLVLFLLMALYTYISKPGLAEWITAGYLLSILTLHIKRPDKRFLRINLANHHVVLFFEYVLLALPLLVCLLYLQFFEIVSVSFLGLAVIPFLGFAFQKKGLNNRIIRAIPDEAFEWKAGVRKYFIFGIIVWLTGLSTSWYVGSVPVAIIVLSLVVVNFFESSEPLSILISPELSPKRFLFRKLLIAQAIISLMLLPLVLAFVLFHPELWYIPVAEYVLISFVLWYAIFLKYAFYRPNEQLIGGQVFTSIGAMSLFLPFLVPLVWILSVRFYLKSISNLNPYLDDFN